MSIKEAQSIWQNTQTYLNSKFQTQYLIHRTLNSITMFDNVTSKDIRKTIVLTKFVPTEYRLWSAQSKATFEVQKILNIVLGTEPKPLSEDAAGIIVPFAELTTVS
jgi:hypothetical protein